ncbi:MAG TPA: fused MFS/spermidine synthase [Candidatus Saccharimonadales bacterium]|nr:fused MFS/spermidine synthase [Candidatus Saccharimonadales bacterium]
MIDDRVVFEGDTTTGHFIVTDTIYAGRPARVLYSGNHHAAQSGEATDDKPELLFDYNERFMELVRGLRPQRVLLIGGGAFALPKALNREFPRIKLDVVEIDGKLYELAQTYFDYKPTRRTHIYIEDGLKFLQTTTEQYDLIIVDAFTNDSVPPSLQTTTTASLAAHHLRSGGVAAMNLIAAYYGERSAALQRQLDAFKAAFSTIDVYPAGHGQSLWLPQNFIVIAQNGTRNLQPHLRYAALSHE